MNFSRPHLKRRPRIKILGKFPASALIISNNLASKTKVQTDHSNSHSLCARVGGFLILIQMESGETNFILWFLTQSETDEGGFLVDREECETLDTLPLVFLARSDLSSAEGSWRGISPVRELDQQISS